MGSDYLFYCRDRADVQDLLERTTEAHWTFMDDYSGRLLARGPTLSDDGEQHTGSLHVVRLPDAAAIETFAYQEPYYRAGAYAAVMIRQWLDLLGRTMHDFAPRGSDPLFLILSESATALDLDAHRAFAVQHRERLGIYGATAPVGRTWNGFAAVIQMPARGAVESWLAEAPSAAHGVPGPTEIHAWRVGGRR